MVFWGANLSELQAFSSDLRGKSSELREILAKLNRRLEVTSWQGPDADRFRAEWHDTFVPALKRLANEVGAAADELKRGADDQRKASSQ